ncbi:MAG: glutaminyl-peptide cyclotransferase, partial [Maribacter sp.]
MHLKKLLIFLFSIFFLISCGSGNQKASSLFSIDLEGNPKIINQNDVLGVSIKNRKDKKIEKVTYSIDGQELDLNADKLNFSIPKLGNKILKATIVYDGNTVEITKNLKILAQRAPEIYTYTILNEYPHDNNAYTQGLEFYNDTLYESTGKKGRSFLRKLDYKTGKVLGQVDLDKAY